MELSMATTWSSLEVIKLAVSTLTPLLVVVVGFWVHRWIKAFEAAQWTQQKIVERRILAYDELAKPLNCLYCWFAFIGDWKAKSPPEIIRLKRELDQTAHISAPLFDGDFLAHYNELLDCCFTTFNRWGDDAKLRTYPGRRQDALGKAWNSEWNDMFVEGDVASEPVEVQRAYDALMTYLGTAMGAIDVNARMIQASHLPINHDARPLRVTSKTPPTPSAAAGASG